MVSPDLKIPESEMSGHLQKLMFLRVLVVSFLLGASIFIQVKETRTYFGDIQTSHYLLIAGIYFLTFFYVILLKLLKNLIKFAYFQLLVDTLFVTIIIYTTGGIGSIFSFLYILTIIDSSIILYRKGGMIIASCSSILYGLLLDLHYYDVIQPFGGRLSYPEAYQGDYIFFMILVNIAGFYLVAFLSSYLAEQVRKSGVELRARQHDIINLEALTERIIRSIASGLITIDAQKKIILFNPAAEDIFGIKSRQAIGSQVQTVLPFLNGYLENGSTDAEDKTKKPHTLFDIPYLRPDGKKNFLRFSISPMTLPDADQKGQILFFQDMTEMKKIEEEMKRVEGLALIGELAAGIAHEIRNPMASISGSIQILKEGLKQDDVNNRLMDIILREINRLNHLVNDFLLFARPKNANLEKFELNQLINDSLELFRNSEKWVDKIRFKKDLRGSIHLESDAEQLKQVLWNLLINASAAMPNGGSLYVSTTTLLDDQNHHATRRKKVKITVRDTGEGFSEKALTQLFTPFFTTKEGGSGLGLGIVKRIIEGLKGEVKGHNHPDGGAEVTIFFDLPVSSLS